VRIVDSHCHTALGWYEPIAPLVEMAYEAFGASRMMWGSDYPPVSVREGYGNALRFTMERLSDKSADERALIFGGVAAKLFGFGER
jgi:L-fuconolactonase